MCESQVKLYKNLLVSWFLSFQVFKSHFLIIFRETKKSFYLLLVCFIPVYLCKNAFTKIVIKVYLFIIKLLDLPILFLVASLCRQRNSFVYINHFFSYGVRCLIEFSKYKFMGPKW